MAGLREDSEIRNGGLLHSDSVESLRGIFRVRCAVGHEPSRGRSEQSWRLSVAQPSQDPKGLLVR
jgi:hypothetical protein